MTRPTTYYNGNERGAMLFSPPTQKDLGTVLMLFSSYFLQNMSDLERTLLFIVGPIPTQLIATPSCERCAPVFELPATSNL
mmetsp:Transcript_21137/g.24283  ORF Transcript_21137/g.24283 Transcript_21137/m.24283 type:complete len:81 (+) Transcript_21137:490-732(+)